MCIHHLYLNAWQTIVQRLLEEIEAKQLLLEIGLHNMSIHKCTFELCIYVKTFKEQHSNQCFFLIMFRKNLCDGEKMEHNCVNMAQTVASVCVWQYGNIDNDKAHHSLFFSEQCVRLET